MFIRYYLELPFSADQVEAALLDSPPEWLSSLARDAQQRGDGLLAEVGSAHSATGSAGESRSAWAPVRFPSMTSLPLTWEPVGMEGLFPRLEADLQIGPLGGERTQLAISARYRPPLGAVGRAVERKPPRPASPSNRPFLLEPAWTILGGWMPWTRRCG
jgi:hypothetical protein